MKRIISIAVASIVVACSPAAEEPLPWTSLPDGSQLMQVGKHELTGGPGAIVRCWPGSGMFECLATAESSWRDVYRFRVPALPTRDFLAKLDDDKPAGYDCSIGQVGSGYQEHVSNDGGPLIQHVVSGLMDLEPGWKASYVNDYLARNGIKPVGLWFDCATLAKAIQNGSLATIGSTTVTRELLDGKIGMDAIPD